MRLTIPLAFLTATFATAQDPGPTPDAKPAKPAKLYDLMVGDPAPSLDIGRWVKGEPMETFRPGKVTVVEFWATWCGPCIKGMPHLSELQAKYENAGVRILGVNIWDEPKNVDPFLAKTFAFHDGKTGDEIMDYTVAVEQKIEGGNIREGTMTSKWMKAAGQNGIPCAFIVDQNAKIAWIGHPSSIDHALDSIVAGTWKLEEQAKLYAKQRAAEADTERYFSLFDQGKYEEAYALGHRLVKGPLGDNAMTLNSIAWGIVDPAKRPKQVDLELAHAAAKRANELTENKDPAILDTLACVVWQKGDLVKAKEIQTRAVAVSKGTQFEDELEARLAELEREIAKRAEPAEASGEKEKPAPTPDAK